MLLILTNRNNLVEHFCDLLIADNKFLINVKAYDKMENKS